MEFVDAQSELACIKALWKTKSLLFRFQISSVTSILSKVSFSCNCKLICISIQKHHWILVFMSSQVLLKDFLSSSSAELVSSIYFSFNIFTSNKPSRKPSNELSNYQQWNNEKRTACPQLKWKEKHQKRYNIHKT